MKLKQVFTYTPPEPQNFTREKDTYKYLRKVLFKDSSKVYSLVLRGLPDFFVYETYFPELPPGMYEVKLNDAPLSGPQQQLFVKLTALTNVFIVYVKEDGSFTVVQVLKE